MNWAALGLLHNPFLEVEPGAHPEWVDVPPAVEAVVQQPKFRLELVGNFTGSGKSTLLATLAQRTPGARMLKGQPGGQLVGGALPLDAALLCVDEAHLLADANLKALDGFKGNLVLGTKLPLGFFIHDLQTVHLERHPSHDWVTKRVAAARVPNGPPPPAFTVEAQRISERFQHSRYGVQRYLHALAELLATGLPLDDTARASALARAVEQPAVHKLLAPWDSAARL